jgi:hypothetical protein
LSKQGEPDDKKKLEEKIMSILSDPRATFDPDHALILSQMHGFSRGTLFLYEKKGLHDQVGFNRIVIKNSTYRLCECVCLLRTYLLKYTNFVAYFVHIMNTYKYQKFEKQISTERSFSG